MDPSQLDKILQQCTRKSNAPNSDQHKLFDRIWKEQEDRLSAHQKYLDESIEINPIPIFVCKASMRYKSTPNTKQKVFLNICSHHLIPNPHLSKINPSVTSTEPINEMMEEGVRFPMSCGPEIAVKDNKNEPATSFDVVFHPDVIKHCGSDPNYKLNVCKAAAQNICAKLGNEIVIEGPYKFPRRVYKGIDENHKEPSPQRIRKTGAARFVQEDGVVNAKCIDHPSMKQEQVDPKKKFKMLPMKKKHKYDDEMHMVRSPLEMESKEEIEYLQYEFNVMFNDGKRKKLRINDVDKLNTYFNEKSDVLKVHKGIQIVVDLTEKYRVQDMQLDIGEVGIRLKHNEKLIFKLNWDIFKGDTRLFRMMDIDGVKAKFVTKKFLLKIECPFVTV